MRTFNCRFLLKTGFYTFVRISSENMNKERAMIWAKKALESEDDFISIDDVYEVK